MGPWSIEATLELDINHTVLRNKYKQTIIQSLPYIIEILENPKKKKIEPLKWIFDPMLGNNLII